MDKVQNIMNKQIKVGAILGYITVIVNIFIGFFSVSLLTKYLGQGEYGVYSLIGSVIGYLSIMDFGMHNVTIRYVSTYKQDDKEAEAKFIGMTFKIYLVIDIVLLLIGGLIYVFFPYIFGQGLNAEELTLAKSLFVPLLFNLLISLPGAVFEAIEFAYEKFIFVKGLLLIKLISKLILMIAILSIGGRSLALVYLDTFLNVLIIVIEMIYALCVLHVKPDFKNTDKKLFKEVSRYTSYVFLASISDQVNWKLDSILLGVISGSAAVAVSSVGMQLVNVFRNFTSIMSGVFLPRVTQMVKQNSDNKKLTDVMITVGTIQLFIIGLIINGFVAVGHDFIRIWAGSEYLDAFWIFFVIALALIIPSTQSIGINILEAKNMHSFRAKVYAFISIFNVLLSIVLIDKYGVIGAAVGTAVTAVVGSNIIINVYYYKTVHLEIPRFFKEVFLRQIPPILLSMITSYLLFQIIYVESMILRVLIKGVAVVAIYIVYMCIFGVVKEIMRVLSIKRSI